MNSQFVDDIMRWMVQGTTWLFYHLGRLIVLGTQKLIVFGVRTNNRAMKKEGVKGQAMDEQERHAQLREVVQYFASHHGYIARGCISKEEIEQLIDSGIDPYELDREIRRRMVEVPGIVLGSQTPTHLYQHL